MRAQSRVRSPRLTRTGSPRYRARTESSAAVPSSAAARRFWLPPVNQIPEACPRIRATESLPALSRVRSSAMVATPSDWKMRVRASTSFAGSAFAIGRITTGPGPAARASRTKRVLMESPPGSPPRMTSAPRGACPRARAGRRAPSVTVSSSARPRWRMEFRISVDEQRTRARRNCHTVSELQGVAGDDGVALRVDWITYVKGLYLERRISKLQRYQGFHRLRGHAC